MIRHRHYSRSCIIFTMHTSLPSLLCIIVTMHASSPLCIMTMMHHHRAPSSSTSCIIVITIHHPTRIASLFIIHHYHHHRNCTQFYAHPPYTVVHLTFKAADDDDIRKCHKTQSGWFLDIELIKINLSFPGKRAERCQLNCSEELVANRGGKSKWIQSCGVRFTLVNKRKM